MNWIIEYTFKHQMKNLEASLRGIFIISLWILLSQNPTQAIFHIFFYTLSHSYLGSGYTWLSYLCLHIYRIGIIPTGPQVFLPTIFLSLYMGAALSHSITIYPGIPAWVTLPPPVRRPAFGTWPEIRDDIAAVFGYGSSLYAHRSYLAF